MSLKRTPLYDTHKRLGGRLVEFAGFEMPVQYSSILAEHAAVRHRAGLFDVSHMGQIYLSGPQAIAAAERLLTCPVGSLAVGRVRYGMLCNEDGGIIDDVTVYRTGEDEVFLCVNAANIAKDASWIVAHAPTGSVDDRSEEIGLLALQGPMASTLLGQVTDAPLAIKRFRFEWLRVAGVQALVSNTGYTGSPGFEIYLAAESAVQVFSTLLEVGAKLGVVPAGLGARDTLRLEAALPLYGHELDDATSPLVAGLDRFVKRDVGGFIGAEAIEQQARTGLERALIGFELVDRGVARARYPILKDAKTVGVVTSGAPSPTLGRSIGLGYVPPDLTAEGTSLAIDVRGRRLAARVVETPFVTPKRAAEAADRAT